MDLPWIEKYRPESLDSVISHREISNTIAKFIDQNRLPHLLLYGPPGTGKTSTILAAAKRIYTPKEIGSMVLELNASDDRGIDVVREQVLNFASTKTLFAGKFKLLILDEADSMTKDAQNALRRIIEKFTQNTRFCLICNYLSKIIPAIQSRCTRFRFAPVPFSDMSSRLQEIALNEQVKVTDQGIKAIFRFASGDMRKAINLLQSASMSAPIVDESSVYACVAYPSPAEIRSLLDEVLNEPLKTAYHNILSVKDTKGIALQDILTELYPLIMRVYEENSWWYIFIDDVSRASVDFPDPVRCELLIALSEIEHRMSVGASEKLQLGALVGAFVRVKNSIKPVHIQ